MKAKKMHIRPQITESQDQFWDQLATPGTWLTGEQRVDVTKESRVVHNCRLCADRKSALSPMQVSGSHESADTTLDENQVELIHKLVSDPGRISRSWVEKLLTSGMTDSEYVEIAALVSTAMVIDTFHTAIGLPLKKLPEPLAGEPTRQRPRTAIMEDGYVPMIAVDALADDYTDLYDTKRWVPNVHRAFSLVPDCARVADNLMTSHYLEYEMVPNYTDADHSYAIDKTQMELVASRVSKYNDCFY